ncbi:hypothetical protein DL769_005237 [Monosporascus sp. CRB-8-3]|nr:hypothetical protein DL769_005237 [Monosporascus sp. CRB-8-3]
MATSPTDSTKYTRLHITPLDESLLNIVIPSSVLPKARNISYHTIETFPEKRYGFLDLPVADADKIKKKLNGAILKGTKMRIEKARPESIPEPTGEADSSKAKKEKKPKDKSKKRKREIDVIPGVELEDRKVKRGWTTTEQDMIKEKRDKSKKDKKSAKSKDDKDKKKEKRKTKSKYTDGPECLFRTKLPEKTPANDDEDAAGHKKKKRKGDDKLTIHEFEKTVKYPSFLKSNTEKTNSEAVTFEDGIGWVDSKGNVVEAVSTKRPSPPLKSKAYAAKVLESTPVPDEDDETSSSGTSSDEESDTSDQSGASEETSDNSEEKVEQADSQAATDKQSKLEAQSLSSPVATLKPEAGRPRSSSSTSLTIKIPPTTPAKVHPLEALYKRPKTEEGAIKDTPQKSEPFAFFDNEDLEEEVSMGPPSQPPMTPFTKQDFEYRNVRSAAPTPDTAHPSRSFNLWPREETLEEALEEDEDEDTAMAEPLEQGTAAASNTDAPTSEFQRQFWENRGDLNRKWRKRKKTVAKEKRYRENKARAQRAI